MVFGKVWRNRKRWGMAMWVASSGHCILVRKTTNRSVGSLSLVKCQLVKRMQTSQQYKTQYLTFQLHKLITVNSHLLLLKKPMNVVNILLGSHRKLQWYQKLQSLLYKVQSLSTQHDPVFNKEWHVKKRTCSTCEYTEGSIWWENRGNRNNLAYLLVNLGECFLVLNPY